MFPKDYNFTNSIQSTSTVTNAQHKVAVHSHLITRHIDLYSKTEEM